MLAQRLVRRLCPECKAAEAAPEALIERFDLTRLAPAREDRAVSPGRVPRLPRHRLSRAAGDRRAAGTDRAIDRLIFEGADDAAIEHAAVERGMRPIFDSGLLAVLEGDTTIEEVVRCIRSEA